MQASDVGTFFENVTALLILNDTISIVLILSTE